MTKAKKHKVIDEETRRIAANFKRLRRQKGWTLYETAQRSIPPNTFQYIGNIERCSSGLGKRARKKWAEIFGVDVSEFLKPLDGNNESDREWALLKEEAKEYGAKEIKRLRQLMPLLLGEATHAGTDKKKPHKDHP